MVTPEQRAAYQRHILENVETHGWFCSSVFDPEKDVERKKPGFSYSVGFSRTLGCPEFIIAGLSMKLGHEILWTAFDQIKAGNTPVNGQPWTDILDGYDVICRPVHHSNIELDYLNSARWFWNTAEKRETPLEAIQIFWPSGETRKFPWDDGCEPDVIAHQVRLDLPNQPNAFGDPLT